MGNQIAVKVHTSPGQEVIVEAKSHMFDWEMAMMAALSGCLARPVEGPRGHLSWSQIEKAISPQVYYRAQTGLLALENTHNMAGGTVMTSEQTETIVAEAHKRGLPVHLDGARVFNAAAALDESVADLSADCDSVMFCLSKGLSAPVGSLLLGSREFVQEARSVRKMMGGGMRQAGVIAAAGIVALQEMPARLKEDHDHARILAGALAELKHLELDLDSVQSNIVVAGVRGSGSQAVIDALSREGVQAVPIGPSEIRFVTHRGVQFDDIKKAVEILRRWDRTHH
jgi:threonine aldolase